ncbi:MAG: hypothetical protein MMC33_002112 [Icmadophila ericetorum]|nr:hypothetical protein [Icmadophila ericetorum]
MRSIAVIIPALCLVPSAYAWGELGHETIAYVAQNFLSAATVTWAQKILGDTSTSYLANAATWADSYRYTTAGTFSQPYHFIDALDSPPSACNVNYDRDCGTGGCVVRAIQNYTSRVTETSLSSVQVQEALQFIIHFLGDIHQPLHDENLDYGGNDIDVLYGSASTNLHAAWDTNMPEAYAGGYSLANAQTWANTLTTDIKTGTYKSQAASWLENVDINSVIDSAMAWATEANAYVCTVVIPGGVSSVQNKDLSTTYYKGVIPTIQLQYARAGYRLAAWLNLIVTGSTGLDGSTPTSSHKTTTTKAKKLAAKTASVSPSPPSKPKKHHVDRRDAAVSPTPTPKKKHHVVRRNAATASPTPTAGLKEKKGHAKHA